MSEVPRPSPGPRPPDDSAPLSMEKTPAYGVVTIPLMQRKLAEARTQGSHDAKVTGLAWGAGLIVVSLGLAFGGWFKAEAMAQEKADLAVERADAGADKKIAPIATDIAVLKTDVGTLKDDVKELKDASRKHSDDDAEIIRLLKRKERP